MAARRRRATTSERVLRILIALVLVTGTVVGGLLVSRTGTDRPAPTDAFSAVSASSTPPTEPTTTTTVPPTTTTTSVCDLNVPIDGCPLGSPAAIAWAQQQDQAAQAAATEQAAQAYDECLRNNAQSITAQILQTFGAASTTGAPTWEPCSTEGLTPAQVQQIQQAEGPQSSTQPNG
jgi:hypothetical protein